MSNKITVKTQFSTSVAESVFSEITSRSSKYYYFLGKAADWYAPLLPDSGIDSVLYENEVKQEIVLVKEVRPSDVSFVTNRVDWTSGTVYDMYDDAYSDSLLGVDIIDGGFNYFAANTSITVTGNLTPGGVHAVLTPVIQSGNIIGVTLNYGGYGYNAAPVVSVVSSTGSNALIQAVVSKAYSGANSLSTSNFYVLTDDYNIYKCLDNNKNSPSTTKPSGTLSEPFKLTDGYKWKFMGTVSPAQRTRFLTLEYIPIARAVDKEFYSQGEIKAVNVLNPGNGYSSVSVTVSGDGYLEENPVYITGPNAVINNQGAGYFSGNTTVTFTPPISINGNWTANTSVFTGAILRHINNIYEVVSSGVTSFGGPLHTNLIASNGTAGFKYRGTVLTGNVTVTSGNVTAVTYDGIVGDIDVTGGGSGYLKAPQISISGGSGAGAAAYSIITPQGSVKEIYVSLLGSGYTSAPTVTVGTQWGANNRVFLNDQIFYNTNLYTVSADSGNIYTALGIVAPTHTSGNVVSGNATLTFAGTAATAAAQLRYGYGYQTSPTANISGAGTNASATVQVTKSSALVTAQINNGQIVGATVIKGGVGYSSATLVISPNDKKGELIADLSQGDLASVQANNELTSVPGAIDRIAIISRGYGYVSGNVVVTIAGNGTGATATANVIAGKIEEITITNRGLGYTKASVIITDTSIAGSGKGASARAILPPNGGHGKDVVNELFAKSLSIFTGITSEKNQGFSVSNEYRQFGIIKDIQQYQTGKYFTQGLGSACWSVTTTSTINPSIVKDSILTSSKNTTEYPAQYRVIEIDGKNILLSSLNNVDIDPGDTLSLDGSFGFPVESIVEPDIDKYSGSLLYVDNRLPFTSLSQTLSFKTIFNF